MESFVPRRRMHWHHERESAVRQRPQPRWGWISLARFSQGSSFLATLGFETESLWDSPIVWFMDVYVLSSKQLLDFIPAQRGGEFFFAADGGLDDLALAILQRQDLFLDRVASDELVAGHNFGLADAVRASRR